MGFIECSTWNICLPVTHGPIYPWRMMPLGRNHLPFNLRLVNLARPFVQVSSKTKSVGRGAENDVNIESD